MKHCFTLTEDGHLPQNHLHPPGINWLMVSKSTGQIIMESKKDNYTIQQWNQNFQNQCTEMCIGQAIRLKVRAGQDESKDKIMRASGDKVARPFQEVGMVLQKFYRGQRHFRSSTSKFVENPRKGRKFSTQRICTRRRCKCVAKLHHQCGKPKIFRVLNV